MNQVANMQRAKGPLVWLDMDQKALDDAYDQAVYAPNRDQVHKRNVFNSERVRQRLGAPKRLAYGTKEIEQLDLFATSKPNAPISIFIHGGAWRSRPVKDYAFLAEMIVRARFLRRTGGVVNTAELFEALHRPDNLPPLPQWIVDWAAGAALPSTKAPAPSIWE